MPGQLQEKKLGMATRLSDEATIPSSLLSLMNYVTKGTRSIRSYQITPFTRSSKAERAALAPSPMAMMICL